MLIDIISWETCVKQQLPLRLRTTMKERQTTTTKKPTKFLFSIDLQIRCFIHFVCQIKQNHVRQRPPPAIKMLCYVTGSTALRQYRRFSHHTSHRQSAVEVQFSFYWKYRAIRQATAQHYAIYIYRNGENYVLMHYRLAQRTLIETPPFFFCVCDRHAASVWNSRFDCHVGWQLKNNHHKNRFQNRAEAILQYV